VIGAFARKRDAHPFAGRVTVGLADKIGIDDAMIARKLEANSVGIVEERRSAGLGYCLISEIEIVRGAWRLERPSARSLGF